MAHRIKTDSNGRVAYPPGNTVAAADTTGTYYSQTSKIVTAFNGHAVEVYADNAVYDTVAGAYLYPGRDYLVNP